MQSAKIKPTTARVPFTNPDHSHFRQRIKPITLSYRRTKNRHMKPPRFCATCRQSFLVHHAGVRSVYFDYNATTPLDADVRAAMLPYMDGIFGNPSSVHHIGQQARAALDAARDRVAAVLKSKPSEIVFTSGGTESDNLAIFGSARLRASQGKSRHLITTSIEHHAVLHCFQYLEKNENFRVTYLPVNGEGIVNPDDVRAAITPETTLVSVMAANNETGAIQPVAEIGRLCRERCVLFH